MVGMDDRFAYPSEEELNAYIDGELDADCQKRIETLLSKQPRFAAKISELRAQDDALRESAEPALQEPAPERLVSIVKRGADGNRAPRASRTNSPKSIGAAILALAAGVAIGWFGNENFQNQKSLLEPYVKQAVLSHELFESNRAFDPIDDDGDTIAIDTAKRPFSEAARTPTLRLAGLSPVMVRTVEGSVGNAIHIAYEDDAGEWTTLYIRRHANDSRLPARFEQRDGYSTLYWIDGPLVYTLVGASDENELRTVADEIYRSRAVSNFDLENGRSSFKPAIAR
jgi:anti-sigma factor RsiW